MPLPLIRDLAERHSRLVIAAPRRAGLTTALVAEANRAEGRVLFASVWVDLVQGLADNVTTVDAENVDPVRGMRWDTIVLDNLDAWPLESLRTLLLPPAHTNSPFKIVAGATYEGVFSPCENVHLLETIGAELRVYFPTYFR